MIGGGKVNRLLNKLRSLTNSTVVAGLSLFDVFFILISFSVVFFIIFGGGFWMICDMLNVPFTVYAKRFASWDWQNAVPFVFAFYLLISLGFFCVIVRLFSHRQTFGQKFIRDKANRVLDFFIVFLALFQIFFLNHLQYLFGGDTFDVKPFTGRELQIIGSIDLYSSTLEAIIGFSFIIFLLVLRLNGVKFDPFVILLFILLNPFLIFLFFSQNMVYFFLFFEGFALVTTLLIVISGQYNGIRVPRYDVLVYLIYSLVGTSLMTLGLTIIFVWTGGAISFFDGNFLYKFVSLGSLSSQKSATLVFFLVCLNIFFKLGVFPFQNWILPVYNSLNTSVLFYVVLFSKFVVSLVFIFKFYPSFFTEQTNWIFFFVGAVSMILGVYFGLTTVRVREIIGASSIVNYGVVMLLISYSAPVCAIFYMLCYTITLFNVMVCLLPYKNRDNDELVETTDKINYRPRMSSRGIYFDFFVVFSVAALIGLPPFLFFYAKIFVLNVFINFGTYGAYSTAVFFLLINVLSAIYYLRLLFVFIKGSIASLRSEIITCYYSGSSSLQTIVKILFFIVLLFGIYFFSYVDMFREWPLFLHKITSG